METPKKGFKFEHHGDPETLPTVRLGFSDTDNSKAKEFLESRF